ncbi:MAG: tetratricopeptide repeat protein, partial [Chloroflexota bacterium]
YDKHLGEREKAFLKIFSVFRLPVATTAFDSVFRADTGSTLNAPLTELEDSAFANLITGLETRRLIKRTERENTTTYSAHPLVQRHYRTALEQSGDDVTPVHKRVAEHYDSTSERPGSLPTLDDLKPYIEMVHHLCSAGVYDEAFAIRRDRISQGASFVLTEKLGADETSLNPMHEFFPGGDTSKEPQVRQQSAKRFILNEVGACLMNLGRLREAIPFYERKNAIALDMGDHHNASIGYQLLAGVYEKLGDLAQMQDAIEIALKEAQQVENEHTQMRDERDSKAYLAWAYHLQGYTAEASETFAETQTVETQIDSEKKYLYSGRGIWYADHLRRVGDTQTALTITETNLIICKSENWQFLISKCHRLLGDLAGDAGAHDEAHQHYDEALRLARNIDRLDTLIEALLGRGRWLAYHRKDVESAFNDLNEALGYATTSGYRIHEADIRVALAWAHLASGDVVQASAEAGRALGASHQMGYHWGVVDAQAVFDALGD